MLLLEVRKRLLEVCRELLHRAVAHHLEPSELLAVPAMLLLQLSRMLRRELGRELIERALVRLPLARERLGELADLRLGQVNGGAMLVLEQRDRLRALRSRRARRHVRLGLPSPSLLFEL